MEVKGAYMAVVRCCVMLAVVIAHVLEARVPLHFEYPALHLVTQKEVLHFH